MPRTRALASPVRLFSAAAAAILATALVLVRTRLFAEHSDIVSWGLTFDLTISIPALYYLFVIRTGRARPLTIAPLFVACTFVAALVIPRGGQEFLHQLRFVAAPLDILTVILIVRRIAAMRSAPASTADDVYVRIQRASAALFGSGVAAAITTAEATLVWYGLFCWRKQPVVPDDARPITIHKRSEWGTIVVCILVLIAFESIGVHLLVQHWSVKIAWLITALDLYGMLWLIGDYQAIRLRPTLVRSDAIEFRHGLRFSVTVARENIVAVEPIHDASQWKRKGTFKLAMLEEPRHLIRLREPVVAYVLGGIRRTIDSIAILPDDPLPDLLTAEARHTRTT